MPRRREEWIDGQAHVAGIVAAASRDADDCRLLFEALGLTPKPRRQAKPARHGTCYRYSKGCRCAACKAAHTARCAQRRAKAKADPSRADRAGHGKAGTYKNHGCRCALCCAAHSQQMKEYAATRRLKTKKGA